jgi:hypothetical protein
MSPRSDVGLLPAANRQAFTYRSHSGRRGVWQQPPGCRPASAASDNLASRNCFPAATPSAAIAGEMPWCPEAVSQAKPELVADDVDDGFAALEKQEQIDKLPAEPTSRRGA